MAARLASALAPGPLPKTFNASRETLYRLETFYQNMERQPC